MQNVRLSLSVLICVCLCGTAWAGKDDKTDSEKQEHDSARAVLAKAKIDLTKAIETAQAKIPAGKVIYAVTADEDKSLLFEVFLLVGDSVTEVEIDAVAGTVKKTEEGEDDEVENLKDAKKVLAESKISFAEAIATAKGKVEGGKAFEVEMEIEDGKSIIEVELLAGDKIMKVEIDALTGKVLEVEEEND
jgi:uncharacterized membrane protein YkoI